VPRVFGGDEVGLPEDTDRPQRDVLEVSDGGGDEVKRACGETGHLQVGLLYHCWLAVSPCLHLTQGPTRAPKRERPHMMSSEPLHHFLDDCLSTLHELNRRPPPSTASTRSTTTSRT